MGENAFAYLRATYWRWAETILDVCPDLANAPAALAVGDIHLENFGTWTDKEGRIVWGVNDYDEAAEMPYILDLVRLATSASLATTPKQISLKAICANVLDGYEHGIEAPEAFVFDRQHMWLRKRFVVGEAARAMFWQKIDSPYHDVLAKKNPEQPPARWLKLFAGAPPDSSITLTYWRHTAGTGSLGRPRWLGYGTWHGGPLLREGKALVPSGWTRAHGDGSRLRLNDIALGKYRAPDPWYAASGNLLVRRLSPDNRKINVEDRRDATLLLHPDLLWAMGRDSPPSISARATAATRCARIWKSASSAGFAPASKPRWNSSPANTQRGKNPVESDCLRMIFSENRFPLFGIMRYSVLCYRLIARTFDEPRR